MPESSISFRGDSYCGLYCGACEVLNLYRDSLADSQPATWQELPKPLRDILPEDYRVACTGCKTDLLSPGCQSCPIRICASEKGVVACVVCGEYPCTMVAERRARIEERLSEVLPHIKAILHQEERIRELGYDAWREEQARMWTCPECGQPFTWYQETCAGCGQALKAFKEYNQSL